MSERERKKKNGGGANCISGFGSGSLDISTRKMTNSGRNHHRFDVSNRAGLRSDRKVSPLSCFLENFALHNVIFLYTLFGIYLNISICARLLLIIINRIVLCTTSLLVIGFYRTFSIFHIPCWKFEYHIVITNNWIRMYSFAFSFRFGSFVTFYKTTSEGGLWPPPFQISFPCLVLIRIRREPWNLKSLSSAW